jgi:DNA invertase Pin-like site-specific DNA recombinase
MKSLTSDQKAAWIYLFTTQPNPPSSNPELARQRKVCYGIAAEIEALVTGIYIDSGYPGLDEERPGLSLLLEHLPQPHHRVTHLIVIRSDRLARTRPLALKLKSQIAQSGVTLVTADPPRYIDT